MVNVKNEFYIWDCKCNSTLFINGRKKNHPRSGAFARIFHVGNYGSWKKNKSQNSLTFYIVHEANFNFHIKVMHAIF